MAVEIVKWQGRCDVCGELAPEMRDSENEARADAEECPCAEADLDAAWAEMGGES